MERLRFDRQAAEARALSPELPARHAASPAPKTKTGRLAPARSRRPVQVRLRCAPVQPGVLHAGGLAGRELVVTGVERVVHVVVDRVDTGLGAGVLTLRAAERGDALRRRV